MPLAAGTRLGDCEILSSLGAGGMGEVYRARDHSLGREVAVKVLPEQLAADPERLRRFEQEARAAAALNHPNILTVFGFGSTNGVPYLVTELLQGQSLRERLAQGPLPVRKAIDLGLQIARGLAAAHDRGIVHRDLKPENLFITRDGVAKILDFGLAKLLPQPDSLQSTILSSNVTQPGVVLGSFGYMSPEQVRGQSADARSDIFSLGTVLYETLSGKRVFIGESAADTMSAILKEEPPDLSARIPNLPPALARIIHRCMEKDPADRFQSARDLAFNMELLTREGSSSSAAVAVSERHSLRWLWPAVAVVAVVAAAALGYFIARGTHTQDANSVPVTLRRLTDFVGVEEYPALSPDGKSVAFTADVNGKREVWVRLLEGGSPLQITHSDLDKRSPRWMADSSSLIFFSQPPSGSGLGQVWEIPALGGTARPLVSSLIAADVSHDGKRLAYIRVNQGKVDLVVGDQEGANPQVVTNLSPDYTYANLRWSPDDQSIGFQRGRTFDFDVYYVPVTGGDPKKITNDGNPEQGFSWLPDSRGIVFSSARGGTVLYMPTMNLWSLRIGESRPRQLTFGETSYWMPDVDKKGNLVATRSRTAFDIWKFPVDGNAKENVARSVQITHQTGTVQTPSVSPDDHEMVYLSDSGGHGNLWILNLATQQSRQLTFEHDPNVMVGVPVWSPDGHHIAYVKRGTEGWNVDQWVINSDGSGGRKISDGAGWACWSTDGKWLYYAPPTATGFRIEKSYPDGSNKTPVQPAGQKPAVSADGTLYYTVSIADINGIADMEIRDAHPDNAEGKFLVRIPGGRVSSMTLVMQPVLSPDGKWLAMPLLDGSQTDIWAQSTSGTEMRQITDFGGQATFIARRVSYSADGKFIYAAVGKGESDIVLLSNLRP